MIKANELRIGNLFDFGKNFYGTIYLDERMRHCVKYLNKGSGSSYLSAFTLDQINPIELTPEILEKAGLNDCKDFGAEWTYIKEDNGKFYLVCDFVKVSNRLIEYLHQLQNIYYSLTGEELEIKL